MIYLALPHIPMLFHTNKDAVQLTTMQSEQL